MNVFLNLDSSDFLIEYIYYDTGNPEIINTDNAPFYFMENGNDNSALVMNADGLESVTNNTRKRSVVEIDSVAKQFALLTTNKLGPAYNDYDSKLTNTQNLPLTFDNTEGVIYDTVRVHLIQGFTFNDFFSGLSLDIKVKDKNGKSISLLNAIYRKEDNYEIMNPSPFLYSGRQYATYLEFKVPSLKFLIDSYTIDFVQGGNDDILSYKISDGSGFYKNTLIELSAGKFSEISKLDNQLFTKKLSSEATSISSQDDFSDIGVFINESSDGDYIEFYGTFNGQIFGDYMQRLNNSGLGKHIAIHKLTITEQLPNTTDEYNLVGQYNPLTNTPNLGATSYLSNFVDGDYWQASKTGYSAQISANVNKGDFIVYNPSLSGSIKVEVIKSTYIENYAEIAQFIRTGEQEFIQDSDFEEPNNFRPVLKFGGSALSYKIDYLLQIFNTSTNVTIEKSGSYVSFQPQKYGKELLKLNTRDNIQVFDVFNKKVINNISNTNIPSTSNSIENTNLYSKNITSFKQVNSVYSGSTEVSINAEGEVVPKVNPDSVANIRSQGTATIYISPFDTFLQFGIYEQIDDGSFRTIDLSKIGQIFLNFTSKKSEIFKIPSTKNQNVDETKGQVLFRVTPEIFNQIFNSGSDVFYITSKVGVNSPESILYTGRYKDYNSVSTDETELLIGQQRQTINDLNDEIREIERNIERSRENLRRESLNNGVKNPPLRPTERRKREGLTANDSSINKQSLNIKTSTFNPFGPGPTSV